MKKTLTLFLCLIAAAFMAISCGEVSKDDPYIELLVEEHQILLSGGENIFSFNYKITHPTEEGQVDILIPTGSDWVEIVSVDRHDEAYGMITLDFSENISEDVRSAAVIVKYDYSGNSISEVINFIQDNIPLEYTMEAKYGICQYYADIYGNYNHFITLTETDINQPVTQYCKLDLYTKNDSEDMMPLPGVYTVMDNQYACDTDFAINSMVSDIMLVDENGDGYSVILDSGEIIVEKNGTVYNIYGDLYDKDGKCYRIRFEGGEFIVKDESFESDFTDDVEVSYSDMLMEAYNVGDKELDYTNMWFITMAPADLEEGDPIIQLSLAYDLDVVDKLEPGIFTEGYRLEPGTFLPGYFSAGYFGSWYFTCGMMSSGKHELGSPKAPFKTGQIELVENGDGTFDVVIDVMDDNDHTVRITCNNVPVNYVDDSDLSK